AAACVNFDATSKNNNLFLLNCRVVTDAGGVTNGNQWYFAATDAGAGVTGSGIQNIATPNTDAAVNVSRKITRAQQASEEVDEGIFLKSASFFTGYTLSSKTSENFIYGTGGLAHHFRVLYNCTGDISSCIAALDLDNNKNSALGGHRNQ